MLIVYSSLTGNVQRFVQKLNMETIKISENLKIDEPYMLITYTTGFGDIPGEVKTFLENNSKNMVGVVGSGNRNWGSFYNAASKKVSHLYNVPLLHTFELSGNQSDVEKVKQEANNIVKRSS